MFLIVGSGNFGLAVTGPVPMPLSLETSLLHPLMSIRAVNLNHLAEQLLLKFQQSVIYPT